MANVSSGYVVELTPGSVARLTALMGLSTRMAAYYMTAMGACVLKVQENAVVATKDGRFRYERITPTGTISRGIKGYVESPYVGVVGVGHEVPYARRREFGFSGQTDALGRTYTNDPGAFYLRDGLEGSRGFIVSAFGGAVGMAVRDVTLLGGTP